MDNKVSNAFNSLSMLNEPLVVKADVVCFFTEKDYVTGPDELEDM